MARIDIRVGDMSAVQLKAHEFLNKVRNAKAALQRADGQKGQVNVNLNNANLLDLASQVPARNKDAAVGVIASIWHNKSGMTIRTAILDYLESLKKPQKPQEPPKDARADLIENVPVPTAEEQKKLILTTDDDVLTLRCDIVCVVKKMLKDKGVDFTKDEMNELRYRALLLAQKAVDYGKHVPPQSAPTQKPVPKTTQKPPVPKELTITYTKNKNRVSIRANSVLKDGGTGGWWYLDNPENRKELLDYITRNELDKFTVRTTFKRASKPHNRLISLRELLGLLSTAQVLTTKDRQSAWEQQAM